MMILNLSYKKKMTMVIESDIIMVDEGVDQSRPGATYL